MNNDGKNAHPVMAGGGAGQFISGGGFLCAPTAKREISQVLM